MVEAVTNFFREHPWILIALVVHGVVLGAVAYLILLERKIASWVQDRIGPNRVGPKGLLQPLADGLKFVVKEDYQPGGVDKVLFSLAPVMMIAVVIVSVAVVPWGGVHQVTRTVDVTAAASGKVDAAAAPATPENAAAVQAATKYVPSIGVLVEPPTIAASNGKVLATVTYRYAFQIATLNIGVLFVLVFLSLAVYGIVIGGWASNNKFSFLGGLRAAAQMISYEIPLGLSVLSIVMMFGTLDLGVIVEKQAHYWLGIIPAWNCFAQPITFVMFLVCIHAEANRAPFDLAECEQELVGGYHTEYSSMRFALFFLAEYAGMITTSAVCVALFFGGWHFPGLNGADPAHPAVTGSLGLCVLRAVVFFTKTIAIIFVFMWVRWSLPRFRFDQLMMLAWRALIPISLALLLVTAIVVWAMGNPDLVVTGRMGLALFIANAAVVAGAAVLSQILPPPPLTNRRVRVVNSRFSKESSQSPVASYQ